MKKGLTITAQQLKFAGGLFFAIVIGYAMWWLFFHNIYERTAEQNMARLYNAIAAACQSPGTRIPLENFNLPQDFIAKVPGVSLAVDPYFYVYYERFPPEPPYKFGEGVPGTIAAMMIPWSEDIPWSSNILATAALDFAFLGLDIFNVKGLGSAAKAKISQLWNKALKSEELQELAEVIEAIKNGGDKIAKGGKIIIKEGKFWLTKGGAILTGATAVGTAICMYYFDKTLGECATMAAAGSATVIAAIRYGPKIYKKINEYITERRIRMAYDELEQIGYQSHWSSFSDYVQELKDAGIVEEVDGELLVRKGEYWDALQEYWMEHGSPEKIEYFSYVPEEGKLKKIVLLKEKLSDAMKEKILYPIEKRLKGLVDTVLHREMVASEGIEAVGKATETISKTTDPEKIDALKKILQNAKEMGRDVPSFASDSEMLEWIGKRGDIITKEGGLGKVLILEKNTPLIEAVSKDTPQAIGIAYTDYVFYTAPLSKEESARLFDLWRLKEFRISEQIKEYAKGTIGYSFLRIQDLYTPLGASYWDKQVSYYSFTGTTCGERELCLQMGYYVRKYPLPESCADVKYVKLKRNSIVAADPNFYLVSPCLAHLEIWKSGDTVYIEPKLCPNAEPNYCFASASLVNWYVSMEGASFWAQCIVTGICAAVGAVPTAGLTLMDIAKGCIGAGGPFHGPCSLGGNFLRLVLDISREGLIGYPYVAEWIQNEKWDQTC